MAASLCSVSADAVMMPSGGMLPLSATLATNSIFEAFQDDSKLKALLHGHSYTAHAIGCSAAVTALDMYTDPACNPNWHEADQQKASPCLAGVWDEQIVDRLSRHARVQQLVVLGRPANVIRNAVCNVKLLDSTMQCRVGAVMHYSCIRHTDTSAGLAHSCQMLHICDMCTSETCATQGPQDCARQCI